MYVIINKSIVNYVNKNSVLMTKEFWKNNISINAIKYV